MARGCDRIGSVCVVLLLFLLVMGASDAVFCEEVFVPVLKFHDRNSDGEWDDSEEGLEGWTIYADEDENGQWDPGEPFSVTGAGGLGMLFVEPGRHVVSEMLKEGWVQTYPPSPGTHTVEVDSSFEGGYVRFGNVPLVVDRVGVVDITKCDPRWLPEFNNTTTFTARTYWLDGGGNCTYPGPEAVIQFWLRDTSRELGVCLNSPEIRWATDLHFNTSENDAQFVPTGHDIQECDLFHRFGLLPERHDHWFIVETKGCVTEATVRVLSEDYGSFGYIEAAAFIDRRCDEDVAEVEWLATLLPRESAASPPTCILGPAKTKIPRDENGNDISDAWWYDETGGNSDPLWDEETEPNPASESEGDGLTRYEEYRGFYVRKGTRDGLRTYRRLSPLRKELFIHRENTAWGAEDAAFAADIYFIRPEEMNGALHDLGSSHPLSGHGTIDPGVGPRVVNFNRTSHTKVAQHGLWLAVGGGDGRRGNWGLAPDNLGTGNDPGSPRTGGRIEVYERNIRSACSGAIGPTFRYGFAPHTRANARLSYNGGRRRDEFIGDNIGHELGHRIGGWHHVDPWKIIEHAPRWTGDVWLDVRRSPGTANQPWISGAAERTCVMSYNDFEIWEAVALKDIDESWYASLWRSRDYHWVWVPRCEVGYGANCRVAAWGVPRPPCREAITIDDAD